MTKQKILLLLVVIFGFILRFWYTGLIPPGVNRDEASIGYTAYSILKTGKDEYGTAFPLSFKSFGDWKLPFYIYTTAVPVKLFGLTDIAVRLPSVIFGSLTILTAYLLAAEIFGRKSKIPILSAFLFAISPWSLHLSRTASEANTAVFFTSLGILMYLRSGKNKWGIVFGSFLLSLSLYIYSADHIFALILFVGLTIFSFRRNLGWVPLVLSVLVFLTFSSVIYYQTLLGADRTKISGLFAVSDPSVVYREITLDRLQHIRFPSIFTYLFHNKAEFTTENTLQNYLRGFSPEFLFITGGGNEQHNIPDFGNLYLWEAPFLLLGIAYLLVYKNPDKKILIFWLLLSPVAASITKDAPHTARMSVVLPLLEILIAYGITKSFEGIAGKKSIAVFFLVFVVVILNFAIWTDRYFIHFPQKRAAIWGEGYKNLVATLNANKYFGAKEMVMSRPEYSPYIYFLFYDKIEPSYFQKSVVRYPETSEGFQHVEKIGNLSFRQIDWSDDLAIPDRIYIDWSSELPKSATESATLITKDLVDKLVENGKDVSDITLGDKIFAQKIADVKLQNNESMFSIVKTYKLK